MSIGANASEKPYCQKLKSQNSKFLPGQVAHCLFLNMVDSFYAYFFNTCLPVRIWLTLPTEMS